MKTIFINIRKSIFDLLAQLNSHAVRVINGVTFSITNLTEDILNAVQEGIVAGTDLVSGILIATVNTFFRATQLAVGAVLGFPRVELPSVDEVNLEEDK